MAFDFNSINDAFKSWAGFESAAPEKDAGAALDSLHGIKQQLLDQLGPNATLEQYRQAAETFGREDPTGQKMVENGEWNAHIAADMSGLDIKGLTISEPKKRLGSDFFNQDSDGAVNDFYANVDFSGAKLKDCIVDPATSYNTQIANAANIDGLTFQGKGYDENGRAEAFVFGSNEYKNVRLADFDKGQIVFANGADVDHLNICGVQASIAMEARASVSNIEVDDATRIIKFDAAPGARISDSDLREATISPASHLDGVQMTDVQFSGSLNGVSMEGATLTRVEFDGADLNGLDLRGANIRDMRINGQPVEHAGQLAEHGAIADDSTDITNSPGFAMNTQLDTIRQQMQTSMAALNPSENEQQKAQQDPQQQEKQAPKIEAAGGSGVDLMGNLIANETVSGQTVTNIQQLQGGSINQVDAAAAVGINQESLRTQLDEVRSAMQAAWSTPPAPAPDPSAQQQRSEDAGYSRSRAG